MKTYRIDVQELWASSHWVKANSRQEALEKYKEGDVEESHPQILIHDIEGTEEVFLDEEGGDA